MVLLKKLKGIPKNSAIKIYSMKINLSKGLIRSNKIIRMTTKLLLSAILWSLVCCTPYKFKRYEGFIYQAEKPLPHVEIFEQDNPENSTQTDEDGFFSLNKRAGAVSRFLMVRKNNAIIDSIQVIRTSAGEQLAYYFTESRKDTLFLKPETDGMNLERK